MTQVGVASRGLFDLFEATFEHYSRTSSRPNNTSIVRRLRSLRGQLVADLPAIAQEFIETVGSDPNLIRLNDRQVEYVCFGDLHGSLTDLVYIRHKYWCEPDLMAKYHFVFLGDYVDRGIHGVEVALYLLLARLAHPDHFTVLRGNHEVAWQNRNFLLDECRVKFGRRSGHGVWRQLNACFDQLPYAALISGAIFCCHGGVPRNLSTMDDIDAKIPKGLQDEHRNALALQLLWNDFRTPEYDDTKHFHVDDEEGAMTSQDSSEAVELDDPGATTTTTTPISIRRYYKYYAPNRIRRIGFVVGHRAVAAFRAAHGLSYIVRAHQFDADVARRGYNLHADGRVITLFSNSAYERNGNCTACVKFSLRTGKVEILSLRTERDAKRDAQSEIFECDELADMKFDW